MIRGFIRQKWLKTYLPILVVLLAGLLHGLVYVFSVPPWQHPDEPGNFEVVWLALHRPDLLKARQFDPENRKLIYASMISHNLFGPNKIDPGIGEPNIIISQLGGNDSPLYFYVVGLPTLFFDPQDIDRQLYAARCGSLFFFLISLIAAWLAARTLAGEGSPIPWMAPLFMAALPGYVDIMSSVNNDVGVACCFSLFVWASFRLLKNGISWKNAALLVVTAVLAALMKITGFIAIPFVILVLAIAIFKFKVGKIAWAVMACALLAGSLVLFRAGDALGWLPLGSASTITRVKASSPAGEYALRTITHPSLDPSVDCGAYQILTNEAAAQVAGKTAAIGAWIWASDERDIQAPAIALLISPQNMRYLSQTVHVTTTPTFYAISVKVDSNYRAHLIELGLSCNQPKLKIYWSGVVLVVSDVVPAGQPRLMGNGMVEWNGKTYQNLARNPAFDAISFKLHPRIQQVLDSYFSAYQGIPRAVEEIQDLPGLGWYIQTSIVVIFKTFWQSCGWGYSNLQTSLPLVGADPYLFLVGMTVLGIGGYSALLIRDRKNTSFQAVIFLFLAMIVVFSVAILRTMLLLDVQVQYSWARYTFPVIVPCALVLVSGWNEILYWIGRLLRTNTRLHYLIYILFLSGLSIIGFQSAMSFFVEHGIL